ncbi:hypothetical protein QA601_02610 [Chitinispirillales bacterium ANBcel5]|uniref:hypothetical protein n=1 Tax=Cellulosispirillum alkaliphilum TaxID=3039283 RepID=UPI002A5532E2|nr:hypothetical protein [Chitinispirillales bacterium ANBcel5]
MSALATMKGMSVFILLSMSPLIASSPFGGFELGGVLYSVLSANHYRGEQKNIRFSGMNTLELRGHNTNREYGMVRLEADFHMLYGDYANVFVKQMEEQTGSSLALGEAPVVADLRELYMAFYPRFADIAVGRQIVTFGRGAVLSPLDIFSTIDIRDIYFKRKGSDVVSVRVPRNILSGIDFISELPVGDNEHASALKYFTTFRGFDLDLIGIYRHRSQTGVAGLAFKGDVHFGIYGEMVTHFEEALKSSHFEFMFGTDYSFLRNNLIFSLEYLYNGLTIHPDSLSTDSVTAELPTPFFRTHYLFFNASYSVNELLRLSGNILYNFDGRGLVGTLLVRYNLLQNVNLTSYIQAVHRDFYGDAFSGPDLTYSARVEVAF